MTGRVPRLPPLRLPRWWDWMLCAVLVALLSLALVGCVTNETTIQPAAPAAAPPLPPAGESWAWVRWVGGFTLAALLAGGALWVGGRWPGRKG